MALVINVINYLYFQITSLHHHHHSDVEETSISAGRSQQAQRTLCHNRDCVKYIFGLDYHSSSSSPSPITLLRALLFQGKILWTNLTSSLLTRSRRFRVAERTFFVPVTDVVELVDELVELEIVAERFSTLFNSGAVGIGDGEPATDDLSGIIRLENCALTLSRFASVVVVVAFASTLLPCWSLAFVAFLRNTLAFLRGSCWIHFLW